MCSTFSSNYCRKAEIKDLIVFKFNLVSSQKADAKKVEFFGGTPFLAPRKDFKNLKKNKSPPEPQ